MQNARATDAASSSDVYARILARMQPDELREHCRTAQKRDVSRMGRQFSQLKGTLRRLREVDAATRALLPDSAASGASVLLARLLELRELHARLGCAADALTQRQAQARNDVIQPVRGRAERFIGMVCAECGGGWLTWSSLSYAVVTSCAAPLDVVADDGKQPTKKRKVRQSLKPLDAVDPIKQEMKAAAWPHPSKQEEHTDCQKRRQAEQPATPEFESPTKLELLEYDSDPNCSARAPTCLEEARKLLRASTEMQSHQFAFLVKKLRNVLGSRTNLEAAEAHELAQTIDIATRIGMNPNAVEPSSPALGDLLIAADHFRVLTGADSAVRTASMSMEKLAAYMVPPSGVLSTAAPGVTVAGDAVTAPGDACIVAQCDGETVIRVNV
ncbi:hypothetical protein PybrP1_009651 [[Pythium] brassicae (nom. inval.)]|nr:hypothetical protein PybrP1_009651 [[Pythium] brassicae (nom. inval.)]